MLSQLQQVQVNTQLWTAWAQVFDLDQNDTADMMYAASELTSLPTKVVDLVRQTPDADVELHVDSWFEPVRQALSYWSSTGTTVQTVQASYDAGALMSLRHVARLIRAADRDIDEPGLAEISDALREIRTMIENATDVEPLFKERLLEVVNGLLRAIRMVNVVGAHGIERIADQGMGLAVTDFLNTGRSPAQAGGWRAKFFSLMTRVQQVMGFAREGLQLANDFTAFTQIEPPS